MGSGLNMKNLLLPVFILLLAFVSCRNERDDAKYTDQAEKTANKRDDAKYTDQAEKTANKLRQEIEAEIKDLGKHEWAGEYYCGDGLGVNVSLMLAPKTGYIFEWHGCLGLYDRNYGTVSWSNDRIHLSFTFENKQEGFQGIAEKFIPISWGDRKYLIPADDIVGFCNNVNKGSEPRAELHGNYLIRNGDENKKATGFPNIPKEFKPYLLENPIQAEIVSVGKYTTKPSVCEWKFKETPVSLNAGKKQGLLPGMELNVFKPDNIVESVKITKVGEENSEALMTQVGEEELGPKIGWKLSTRAPWHNNDQGDTPQSE